MIITASITIGGTFVYLTFANANEVEESFPSIGYPSQSPSVKPYFYEHLSQLPTGTWTLEPHTNTDLQVAPSTNPSSKDECSNDQAFEFIRANGDVGTCEWLLNNTLRKNKYCPLSSIKQQCCLSCASNYQCVDDYNYMFTTDNGNRQYW